MDNFSKLLFVIIERDKKIEIRKEVLAQIQKFNPWEMFKLLSECDPLGYISSRSLKVFLKENGIPFDSCDEVEAFIDSF